MKTFRFFFAAILTTIIGTQSAQAGDTEVILPQFSYDAKKLAYLVADVEKVNGEFKFLSTQIWTANADGSDARQLTKGRVDGNTRWSPDGKKIAFLSDGDVWMVNTDGTGLKQITKTKMVDESSPEFSNDGKILYFVRVKQLNAAANIKGADPIYVDEPGQIIAYSVAAGTETRRFVNEDSFVQVVPNRADGNEVYVVHHVYDPKLKTEYGVGGFSKIELSALRLDGKGKRVLRSVPEEFRPPFEILSSTLEGLVVKQDKIVKSFGLDIAKPETVLLDQNGAQKAFKDGTKILKVALDFSDISRDGKLVTGIRPVFLDDESDKMEITIRIIDLAADEITDLSKKSLLGKAVVAKAVPPAPKVPETKVPETKAPEAKPVVKTEPVKRAPLKPEPWKKEPPAEAKKHYELGNTYVEKEYYGAAIDEYSKAIELHPQYAEAYYGRGLCYVRRYEGTEALPDLNMAIQLNPNHLESYFRRAIAHLIVGDNAASLADLDTAVRLAPNSAQAYSERGHYYHAIGDYAKRDADYAKAKSLEKKN